MAILGQGTPAGGKGGLSPADPNSESRESREDRVHKDLAHRLGHVCEDLSRVDFEALVTQMTREQLRGERTPGFSR